MTVLTTSMAVGEQVDRTGVMKSYLLPGGLQLDSTGPTVLTKAMAVPASVLDRTGVMRNAYYTGAIQPTPVAASTVKHRMTLMGVG